ncbi:MAG: ribonuclease P protein component [Alphaproteobacteria bacterium]
MSPVADARVAIQRLKRRPDFLRVAGGRRKWVAPGLILQAAPMVGEASGGDVVRVGFTVTRKVGNAVVRNRVRRRLKAAAGLVMPGAACPGFDYVLIGRGGTLERPFADLVLDLRTALARVGTGGGSGRGGAREASGGAT